MDLGGIISKSLHHLYYMHKMLWKMHYKKEEEDQEVVNDDDNDKIKASSILMYKAVLVRGATCIAAIKTCQVLSCHHQYTAKVELKGHKTREGEGRKHLHCVAILGKMSGNFNVK
eukprot:12956056-Ditylum_brightwellii.AAC.1